MVKRKDEYAAASKSVGGGDRNKGKRHTIPKQTLYRDTSKSKRSQAKQPDKPPGKSRKTKYI